jgi:hypothetical protein
MRTVRFTQSMMPYRRGDVAEFEDAVAERIIRKGFAETVGGDGEETASAEERPAEPRRRRARPEDPA